MASSFQLLTPLETPLTRGGGVPPAITQYVSQFEAVFNFTGHGANNQIKDMPKIEPILDKLVADNNKLYGHKWLACYGGDPYDSSKLDIAAVMKYIGEKGVPVLAVQCSEYGGYMFNKDGVLDENSYSFLAAAAIYETELGTPPMVPNPKKPGAMKKNIQFGGFETDTSHLLGTTHYVFDALFGDKMKGHIACGGGPIALQEMEAAFDRGLRCLYIPTEAKHGVTLGDGYGVMHTWFSQNGLPLSAASSGWGWVKPVGAQESGVKRKFEVHPWHADSLPMEVIAGIGFAIVMASYYFM